MGDLYFLSRGHEDFCRTKDPVEKNFFRSWSDHILFKTGINAAKFYINLKEPPYYKLVDIDHQKVAELRDELVGDYIEWIELDSIFIPSRSQEKFTEYREGHTGRYMGAFTESVKKYGIISPVLVLKVEWKGKSYNLIEGKHRAVGAFLTGIKGLKIPALVMLKAIKVDGEDSKWIPAN